MHGSRSLRDVTPRPSRLPSCRLHVRAASSAPAIAQKAQRSVSNVLDDAVLPFRAVVASHQALWRVHGMWLCRHDGCRNAKPRDDTGSAASTSGAASVSLASAAWLLGVFVVAPTSAGQRAALVDLFVSSGTPWSEPNDYGWRDYSSGSDPCDELWDGVECSGGVGDSERSV